jgi:hypothetical protein
MGRSLEARRGEEWNEMKIQKNLTMMYVRYMED